MHILVLQLKVRKNVSNLIVPHELEREICPPFKFPTVLTIAYGRLIDGANLVSILEEA